MVGRGTFTLWAVPTYPPAECTAPAPNTRSSHPHIREINARSQTLAAATARESR